MVRRTTTGSTGGAAIACRAVHPVDAEVRRFKPSTVSRCTSVATRFYRTACIDGVLEHSSAEFVRRPNVPPESPHLRLTQLQLEALLTSQPRLDQRHDFALVCLLNLLGLLPAGVGEDQ